LNKKKTHTIDIIFPLALFLVFTASALLVILLAANTYRNITTQSHDNYTSRTSLSYIREKIRHNDASGSIDIGNLDGEDCLLISQSYGGSDYITYIYQDRGSLKELFVKDGVDVNLSNGTEIMPVEDFSVEKETDTLYFFTVIDTYGNEDSILINIKSRSVEREVAVHE